MEYNIAEFDLFYIWSADSMFDLESIKTQTRLKKLHKCLQFLLGNDDNGCKSNWWSDWSRIFVQLSASVLMFTVFSIGVVKTSWIREWSLGFY